MQVIKQFYAFNSKVEVTPFFQVFKNMIYFTVRLRMHTFSLPLRHILNTNYDLRLS